MRETDTRVVGRWKREAERDVEGGCGRGARPEHIPIGRSRIRYWHWLFFLMNREKLAMVASPTELIIRGRFYLPQVRFNQALSYLGS